jgi:hypothetical protein
MIKFLEPLDNPPTLATFDLEGAKERIFFYLGNVNKMYEQAEALVVNSEATNVDATALGTTAMALYNKIRETKIKIPNYLEAKEFVGKVDDFEKMLTEKLYTTSKDKRTVVSITKAKISQYAAVLESERRKQEELAKKAQEKLQQELNEQAKKTGTVAPQVQPVIIPKKETTVRTETGSAHAVHKWTCKIEDIDLVPVELLRRAMKIEMASKEGPKALKAVIQEEIKKGVRDPGIPGVHIYEDITTSFRT